MPAPVPQLQRARAGLVLAAIAATTTSCSALQLQVLPYSDGGLELDDFSVLATDHCSLVRHALKTDDDDKPSPLGPTLLFVCGEANDLYATTAAAKSVPLQRFATAELALAAAKQDDVLLLLADGYPFARTAVAADTYAAAAKKQLKLFVEFPAVGSVPAGVALGANIAHGNLTFQRLVVSAKGGLGTALPRLKILYAHGASWAPVADYNCMREGKGVPGSRVSFNTTTTASELCWKGGRPDHVVFKGTICGEKGQILWESLRNLNALKACSWNRSSIDSTARWLGACGVVPLSIDAPAFVCKGVRSIGDPWLVSARVAGYDTAVYGLENGTIGSPILFVHPVNNDVLVATTQLSSFRRGRFAPTKAWQALWQRVFAVHFGLKAAPLLEWKSRVRPAFGKNEPLPAGAIAAAAKRGVAWLRTRSKMLPGAAQIASISAALNSTYVAAHSRDPSSNCSYGECKRAAPADDMPEGDVGDGRVGILEGYTNLIQPEGSQFQVLEIRADCNSESAMLFAADAALMGASANDSSSVAANLLDFVTGTSGLQNPLAITGAKAGAAAGLLSWTMGGSNPAGKASFYGDDNARATLGLLTANALLGAQHRNWASSIAQVILGNYRTTSFDGFRYVSTDTGQLQAQGWRAFAERNHSACCAKAGGITGPCCPGALFSPHMESYPWAVFLQAYHLTEYEPFKAKAKAGISTMMANWPHWAPIANGVALQKARILLPLAWLVRVEDTPEHRRWLSTIFDSMKFQANGAIQEEICDRGWMCTDSSNVPPSNDAYGLAEAPLQQTNADPVTDALYTVNFAALGLREAVAATGNATFAAAEKRLVEYLVRIQQVSDDVPTLDGAWMRAFDFEKWEVWASASDIGWGPWCVETGWMNTWIITMLAVHDKNTSIWAITSDNADVGRELRSWMPYYMKTDDADIAPLHGGRFIAGHGAAANPDPLRDYVWNTSLTSHANESLQLITLQPAAVSAHPATAFSNVSSLISSNNGTARALADGTLRVDFGMELAAWLELTSPDLTPGAVAAGCVSMSIGESFAPKYFAPNRLRPKVHNATNPLFDGWKTEVPTVQGDDGVYRLELNAELYEGVRYGFLHVNATGCGAAFAPFTITSMAAMAQVKPANWAAFAAPGRPTLTRAWYVGGYTVKLNLGSTAIGSILDQRGDRTPKGKFIGFAGDAHVAQAASMVAFGNFDLVRSMQRQLSEFDSSYGTYCMYWVLSLSDIFAATHDTAFVKSMLAAGLLKMRRSFNRAGKPLAPGQVRGNMLYAGWDERFNFAQLTAEGKYYPESVYIMQALYVRASLAFADLADAVGNATLARTYKAEAAKMTKRLRSGAGGETPGNEWWRPLGLHASAHAANAGLVNATEAPLVFAARFNDSGKICSFSNFNQYFVLQGVASLGYPKHALALIELCWGAELALGATSFWEVSGYGGAWAAAFGNQSSTGGGGTPPVPGHSTGANSKCHPWAAGVTPWLTHEAAGLRPRRCSGSSGNAAASAICLTVRPLLDSVSATLPMALGDVAISVDATSGTHALRIPAGVVLTDVSLPLAAGCVGVESVTLVMSEGDEVGDAKRTEFTVIPAPWQPGNGLFDSYVELDVSASRDLFDTTRARSVEIQVHCKLHRVRQQQEVPAYGRPVWDIPMVRADAATHGAWVGRYGTRGHLLFGLERVNGSRSLVQPFIVDVSWRSGGAKESNRNTGTVANVDPADPKFAAALELPHAASPGHRAIGFLATNSIEPMAIEVTLQPTLLPASAHDHHRRCVNISLYFVDWTGTVDPIAGSTASVRRKSAVDVFTVAPGLEIDVGYATAVVGHPSLADGEYRTWRACADALKVNATGFAAVRFRTYIVTGSNASVSAVFFD